MTVEDMKNAVVTFVNIAEEEVISKEFEELDKNGVEILKALDELEAYRAIGTVEVFKYLKQSEHGYDNCHNITCRTKCKKDGYAKAIEEFAEKMKEEFGKNIFSDEEKFKYARKEQEQICAQNMTWKMAIRLVDYFAKELKGE
jgi:hypothetical protein